MKYILLLFLCITANVFAQTYKDSIIELRIIHTGELIDSSTHILSAEEIASFQGLAYFDVDSNFRITANFTKSIGKKFKMPTSTARTPIYRRFGYVDFLIEGEKQTLTVYQNMALRKQKEFKNYLFIPFRDATSNHETYGGGRYLDLQIPSTNKTILDLNTVYNPYCVYSHRYSCPIPPAENTLKVQILAGEKVPVGYSKD
ncbi:MAG: hypothetical protein RI883_213 [Bacteroidota bacterium]|jgi:uncharacterized protein (DUF1684 family)